MRRNYQKSNQTHSLDMHTLCQIQGTDDYTFISHM